MNRLPMAGEKTSKTVFDLTEIALVFAILVETKSVLK
jgi:hypothetical protein